MTSNELEKDRQNLNKTLNQLFNVENLENILKENKLTSDLMLEKDVFQRNLKWKKLRQKNYNLIIFKVFL